MNIALIIPAYNPNEQLIELVEKLKDYKTIIVNDGSAKTTENIFKKLETFQNTLILEHLINKGKGAALKTAFQYILETLPDTDYVVTVDADGQHNINSINNLTQAITAQNNLIIGQRSFKGNVPLRSLIGNTITKYIFYYFTGTMINDTQSGLRAIPTAILENLCNIKSNRYEFETETLIEAVKLNIPIKRSHMDTIYIDGNKESHFRPIIDSIRIYYIFIKFIISSIATALTDLSIFTLSFHLFNNLFISNALGRLLSLPLYFYLNKNIVFSSKESTLRAASKLIITVIFCGLISYGAQRLMLYLTPISELSSKIFVETLMFLLNFLILRDFVFKNKTKPSQIAG